MRTFFITAFLCFNLFLFQAKATDNAAHKPGELIVMISAGSTIQGVMEANLQLDGKPTQLEIAGALAKKSGIWLLKFDFLHIDEEALLKRVRNTKQVVIAQFNHYISNRSIPDDLQFANQYALNNTGQSGGVVDADIDATDAWNITTGGLTASGDTIVVAIVDDGFQLTHPDLNFWLNRYEIAGNAIDDDGNGFVDDVKGWNVFLHNGNISNAQHGTHVAGIIGAKGNNAMGVSGVNWNVKLMPVVGATETESEAVEAYSYVLECRRLYNETNGAKGAFVVASNSSFGVDMGQPANFPIWCAYYDSLGKVGILSAAATANNNWNIDVTGDIPCSCSSDFLVSVSATSRYDTKIVSAGYGVNTIDLGAPGHQVLSTYPSNNYASLTGTSMASPHVAGSIALMYAAACDTFIYDYKLYPDSMAKLMKDFVLTTVDLKPGFDTLFASGGRLNVFNAINALQQYGNCSMVGLNEYLLSDKVELYPNPANDKLFLSAKIPDGFYVLELSDLTGRLVKKETMRVSGGDLNYVLNVSSLDNGVYYILLKKNETRIFVKRLVKAG
ncbi:MAG TPA: S8 family serine peptidase [Bacteroidia bacterium]